MKVYRLDPIAPGDPSWQYSIEKDSVWRCAASPNDARKLVAEKAKAAVAGATAPKSPWLDAAVTSCAWEPSIAIFAPAPWSGQTAALLANKVGAVGER
jgi:hypothetical protein